MLGYFIKKQTHTALRSYILPRIFITTLKIRKSKIKFDLSKNIFEIPLTSDKHMFYKYKLIKFIRSQLNVVY